MSIHMSKHMSEHMSGAQVWPSLLVPRAARTTKSLLIWAAVVLISLLWIAGPHAAITIQAITTWAIAALDRWSTRGHRRTPCHARVYSRAGTPFDGLDESFPMVPWHMPQRDAFYVCLNTCPSHFAMLDKFFAHTSATAN